MVRWTATLDLDIPGLLPEFGFPPVAEVVEFLKAEQDAREAEAERLRREHLEAHQANQAITINGPVQSVNQGNDAVSQIFNNHASTHMDALLGALRQVAQDDAVPCAERNALAVAAEQVEKNAEKPAAQESWLKAARDTLEAIGAIPAAVTAMKLIAAYLGARV